jgi:hypothetical protein
VVLGRGDRREELLRQVQGLCGALALGEKRDPGVEELKRLRPLAPGN